MPVFRPSCRAGPVIRRGICHPWVWSRKLPWCINTGKSLIPLTLLFLHQKRNLLIPLELSRVMHQGTSLAADAGVKP